MAKITASPSTNKTFDKGKFSQLLKLTDEAVQSALPQWLATVKAFENEFKMMEITKKKSRFLK
ncbi:hypothetical protein, partial [Pediococcus damnosus]